MSGPRVWPGRADPLLARNGHDRFAVVTIHFLSAGTDTYRWLPFWLNVTVGCAIGAACVVGSIRAERRLEAPERTAER